MMTTVKFQLDTLSCPSCVKKIEGTLNSREGVKEARVLFNSSKVKVVFDESRITMGQLEAAIRGLGYAVFTEHTVCRRG